MICKGKSGGGSGKDFLSHKEKGPKRDKSFVSTFPSAWMLFNEDIMLRAAIDIL